MVIVSITGIVADATLHRRKNGPLRLVGRIKWLIDPEWRGAGLGTLLVNHFIDTARVNGLRHLAWLVRDDEAVRADERSGSPVVEPDAG